MSEASRVDVSIEGTQSSEAQLTEFNLYYYGWRVVLAACLGVMAGFGSLFLYTFSVFVKPLALAFGWNREAISGGFAIAAVTLGMASPLLGWWTDRFGLRRIILPCMTIYVCGVFSLSLLRFGLWQFYVICFVEPSGKRRSASGVFAIDFDLVRAAIGNGAGVRHGRSRFGSHDFARDRTIGYHSLQLAYRLRSARWLSCWACRSVGDTSASAGRPNDARRRRVFIRGSPGSRGYAPTSSGLSPPFFS